MNLEDIIDLAMEESNSIIQPRFQAINNVGNLEISGYEVLIRIVFEGREYLPCEFFPILQKRNLMNSFCEKTALLGIDEFTKQHKDSLLSINLSKTQIEDPHTLTDILSYAKKKDILSKIVIEILEEDINMESIAVKNNIGLLMENNITVAIDDFGAGSSSFLRLLEIPHLIIKVDKKLFKYKTPYTASLLKHILAIGHENGKIVLAEGIETFSEFEFIKALDYDLVQGFLFSVPSKL